MEYLELLPSRRLRRYINCFWMLKGEPSSQLADTTFPDACQEIIFNVNSKVMRRNLGDAAFSQNPSVELVGQMTKPYEVLTQGEQLYFGIKFYPHSMAAFTQEASSNLIDQSIDCRDLFADGFDELEDQVLQRPHFTSFVRHAEHFFKQRLAQSKEPKNFLMLENLVKQLFAFDPALNLKELAREYRISMRHMQKLFQRHIGLSPVQVRNILRFQSTFGRLQKGEDSLTSIAYDCGYYDQAHFINEFKAYAGKTPSDYLNSNSPLLSPFLSTDSYAYLCNYQ